MVVNVCKIAVLSTHHIPGDLPDMPSEVIRGLDSVLIWIPGWTGEDLPDWLDAIREYVDGQGAEYLLIQDGGAIIKELETYW